jgi:ATP-dependent exoDNAse (exonuclease V) beta subunit
MYEIITELNKFNNVVFNEEDHSYYLNFKRCISTTELIGRFKKKFETELMSSLVAKRDGRTKDDVIAEWDEKRITSQIRGTELHKCAELMFQSKGYKPDPIVTNKLYKMLQDFHKDYKNILALVRAELVVGDDTWGVCGMIDKLFYNTLENELQIWDYKTNKEIKTTNKYKMINGLNHLEECEFNTYSLQLSIYKKIIEKNTNLKIGKSYLCWINEENDSYEIIETKYFDAESTLMLNSRIDEYNFSLFE